jgi:outer membrane protein TolC
MLRMLWGSARLPACALAGFHLRAARSGGQVGRAIGGALLLMLAQTACVTYTPKPLEPARTLPALEARSLDDPALRDRLSSLLPAPPPGDSWDGAQLLVAGMQLSPALTESRAHIAEALASVTTARTYPNPNLGLSFEYDLQRYAESPWLWGASLGFLIDTALRRELRTQLAETAVRGARLDYAEAIWSLRRDLRAALLGAVLAERRIALLAVAEQDRSDLVRLVSRRVEAGAAPAPDRLQASVELARTRTALADARRQLVQARAQVAHVIGLPVAALEGRSLRWDELEAPPLPDAPQIAGLRERALLSRPDLERAVGAYQASEIELRQQVRAQYPELTVAPGYLYDHGIRKATLGVSFNLPLFDHNRGPIAEALARRESSGQHLLAVQGDILNEIDGALGEYRLAQSALASAREQRLAADALAANTERSFAAGAEDRPALLSARLAANADALAELDAVERAQTILGQLEDALRTPLAGPETKLRFTGANGEL